MIYVWGFKEIEIAHCFGVTESRISQRLKGLQARLSQTLAVQELSPVEGVRKEVSEISERERAVQACLATLLPTKGSEQPWMELPEVSEVEKEKAWALEGHHEEGVPEWFA